MRNEKNKKIVLSVLGILSLVIITIGVTYAIFTYTRLGSTENTVTTGTLKFLYTENTGVGNGISIENAFPVSDTVGKSYSTENYVFDFKVEGTNTGKDEIPYEVTLRKKSTSTLSESNVKVYLTDMTEDSDIEILEPTLYSDLTRTNIEVGDEIEKTLYNGSVLGGKLTYLKEFRLRMWIDETSNQDEINGKTFTATVNVYSNVPLISEEEIALRNNNEITSIEASDSYAVEVANKEYNYEIGLPSGTTTTSLNIDTVNDYTKVEVEKVDSIASIYSSDNSIKRLSATNNITLTEGNNYFKITTTSEDKETVTTSVLNIHVGSYSEEILNGTDPILNKLIPIIIDGKGVAHKVDTNYTWYSYQNKEWANAVILKDESVTYTNGEEIPEANIESYFVWIPRYKYKIFDTGSYTGLTSISSKEQVIEVVFENKNTTPSNGTTVDSFLTHPAFTSFDSNGFWVGKFETGYDGATSTTAAQVNSVATDKIIIKPNVYSWRSMTVGNMFKNSYDYMRELDSHMMKNTEWGAVAYLQHSAYGSATSVRINNNSAYITGYSAIVEPTLGYSATSIEGNRYESTSIGVDGTYTVNYLNRNSQVSSTTGNYTGIYDMSGGAWEYVMGYTTGASTVGGSSGITSLYPNFFSDSNYTKYWDKYTSTSNTNYNNRILGDATGEMGPFGSRKDPDGNTRNRSSWYDDIAQFVLSSHSWFVYGGNCNRGSSTGIFAFGSNTGEILTNVGYHILLTPQ